MKVLIISVHPDDEALGCAGTIFRHCEAGDDVEWLIVTAGDESRYSRDVLEQKAAEVTTLAEHYGMSKLHWLKKPTTMLDTLPIGELIGSIGEVIGEVKPDEVYLIHDGDVHTDHHVVFNATMSVLKTFYMNQRGVKRVLSYETLSSTDAAPPLPHRAFLPTVYKDITPFLEQKLKAMSFYASESQGELEPRGASAIEALARYRGASIGVKYAEAFMLIREVD